MSLPYVRSYGHYNSDNYGVSTLVVDTGGMKLYYSYDTIVAYQTNEDGLVVCENVWSQTTGKHLNWIQPDHSLRIDHASFQASLSNAIAKHLPR